VEFPVIAAMREAVQKSSVIPSEAKNLCSRSGI
jgi:hypothetical protein